MARIAATLRELGIMISRHNLNDWARRSPSIAKCKQLTQGDKVFIQRLLTLFPHADLAGLLPVGLKTAAIGDQLTGDRGFEALLLQESISLTDQRNQSQSGICGTRVLGGKQVPHHCELRTPPVGLDRLRQQFWQAGKFLGLSRFRLERGLRKASRGKDRPKDVLAYGLMIALMEEYKIDLREAKERVLECLHFLANGQQAAFS